MGKSSPDAGSRAREVRQRVKKRGHQKVLQKKVPVLRTWRCGKDGRRFYVGSDGQRYFGASARHRAALDRSSKARFSRERGLTSSPSIREAQCSAGMKKELMLLEWGVPHRVCEEYRKSGVRSLYQWQCDCLKMADGHQNLLYSAPTSGGKSLVCELIMLRTLLWRKRKSLLVLPFVSLVLEKHADLRRKLCETIGVSVDCYHSNRSLATVSDCDILVATIEKANGIINKLISEQSLDQLGCVVVDEVHLLADSQRGYLIESMLSKLQFLRESHKIQVIGMSATLPNLTDLSRWLSDAKVFESSVRPVELTEYYYLSGVLYNRDNELVRKVQPLSNRDSAGCAALTLEVICKRGRSVLVFVESKRWTRNCARVISRELSRCDIADEIRQRRNKEREQLIIELKRVRIGDESARDEDECSKIWDECISMGVGFHNAGLLVEERQLVEQAFRSGVLSVLVSTSTLAAGVNLPARRVIFRDLRCGPALMAADKYRQMCGRAGRKGLDVCGESVILCENREIAEYARTRLIGSELTPARSALLDAPKDSHLRERLILEGVCLGIAQSEKEITLLMQSTLMAAQTRGCIQNVCREAVSYLQQQQFVKLRKQEETILEPTQLGRACVGSGLSPSEGRSLFGMLQQTREQGLLLSDDSSLQLCYLMVPLRSSVGEPDWPAFYDFMRGRFWRSHRDGSALMDSLQMSEERLRKYAGNAGRLSDSDPTVQRYRRVHSAVLLWQLIQEVSLRRVSLEMGVSTGQLQNLQQMAAAFASNASLFCSALNWDCLALVLAHFSQRLSSGVCSELVPLLSIPAVSKECAKALRKSGLLSIESVANATIDLIYFSLSSRIAGSSNSSDSSSQNSRLRERAQRIQQQAHSLWVQQHDEHSVLRD